jgi:hypothetical protein
MNEPCIPYDVSYNLLSSLQNSVFQVHIHLHILQADECILFILLDIEWLHTKCCQYLINEYKSFSNFTFRHIVGFKLLINILDFFIP